MSTVAIRISITCILFVSLSQISNGQDPLSFFPHNTGNMLEYFWVEPQYPDTLQSFIFQDSVGSDGRIHVTVRSRFINPIVPVQLSPLRVAIDTTLKQVWGDFGYGYGILYKLAAQQGDKWVMSRLGGGYEMCRVYSVEQGTLLGRQTTIKRYVYYGARDSSDTLGFVNADYWLASGFGLMYFSCPDCFYYIYLKGAVIDGVLYGDTTRIVTSVPDFSAGLPTQFELFPPYPNPFNPSTTIRFKTQNHTRVSLIIHDALGKEIKKLLHNESFDPGSHEIVWDGTSADGRVASSGVYFCRLSGNGNSITRSMILLK